MLLIFTFLENFRTSEKFALSEENFSKSETLKDEITEDVSFTDNKPVFSNKKKHNVDHSGSHFKTDQTTYEILDSDSLKVKDSPFEILDLDSLIVDDSPYEIENFDFSTNEITGDSFIDKKNTDFGIINIAEDNYIKYNSDLNNMKTGNDELMIKNSDLENFFICADILINGKYDFLFMDIEEHNLNNTNLGFNKTPLDNNSLSKCETLTPGASLNKNMDAQNDPKKAHTQILHSNDIKKEFEMFENMEILDEAIKLESIPIRKNESNDSVILLYEDNPSYNIKDNSFEIASGPSSSNFLDIRSLDSQNEARCSSDKNIPGYKSYAGKHSPKKIRNEEIQPIDSIKNKLRMTKTAREKHQKQTYESRGNKKIQRTRIIKPIIKLGNVKLISEHGHDPFKFFRCKNIYVFTKPIQNHIIKNIETIFYLKINFCIYSENGAKNTRNLSFSQLCKKNGNSDPFRDKRSMTCSVFSLIEQNHFISFEDCSDSYLENLILNKNSAILDIYKKGMARYNESLATQYHLSTSIFLEDYITLIEFRYTRKRCINKTDENRQIAYFVYCKILKAADIIHRDRKWGLLLPEFNIFVEIFKNNSKYVKVQNKNWVAMLFNINCLMAKIEHMQKEIDGNAILENEREIQKSILEIRIFYIFELFKSLKIQYIYLLGYALHSLEFYLLNTKKNHSPSPAIIENYLDFFSKENKRIIFEKILVHQCVKLDDFNIFMG